MRPAEITGSYIQGKQQSAFMPLSIMTGEQLASLGAWQVSDAMQQLPSAFVKNYGGLSAMKTISLRGTTSQQTLVLLDGTRLASSATGTVDLSAIPLVFFDDIELSGGGSSAQNGGGAMAGVVNLQTRQTSQPRVGLNLAGGSFGDAMMSAVGSFPFAGVRWRVGGEFVRSDGGYPFLVREFGVENTRTRTNSDFRNIGFTLGGILDAHAWKITNRLFIRTSERGAPGAVLQGVVEQNSARLGDDELLFVHSSTRSLTANSSLLLSGSARYSNLRYRDKDALFRGPDGAHDLYITREAMLSMAHIRYGSDYSHRWGVEWSFADLRGSTFQPGVGSYVKRSIISLSGSGEKQWNIDSNWMLSTQLQARFEINSSATRAFSPMLSFALRRAEFPVRLRSSWSYNFRLPSFNELYYFNYGTANLLPERAHSFNVGAMWQITDGLSAEVNGFAISTSDQILAVPTSPISWSAQNIGSVFSRGVESSITGEILDSLMMIRCAYTRQLATDESPGSITAGNILPTIPQELFSVALSYKFGEKTTFGGSCTYSSFRYYTADNSPEYLLPSYGLVTVYGEHTIALVGSIAALRLECSNLLNTSYSVIINYPMPTRSFRLGLRMIFSDTE